MRLYYYNIILIILSTTSIVFAKIIHVPQEQTTIQEGIDAADDGDTVLVDTGTYVENINFSGKNIVVGSLFLMTGDTSYVSQTIIDGNKSGSVVTFENREDSTAVLSGFKITNGRGSGYGWESGRHITGGGITCKSQSSPILNDLMITGNVSYGGEFSGAGGGIYCADNSSPIIINVLIVANTATGWWSSGLGGGLFCGDNSNPTVINSVIADNIASEGGGIACWNSSPALESVKLRGNTSSYRGGGIFCESFSNPQLVDVTISGNVAYYFGGGISSDDNSNLSFDSERRCNIYLNYAGSMGGDLYFYNFQNTTIFVDTFTVMNPTDHHSFPVEDLSLDIIYAKVEPVNADLYVSSYGNDSNSGEFSSTPLRTISFALSKILADSLSPHTIYIANGIYSRSRTGENFPLFMAEHISLLGESESGVILDAEGQTGVIYFDHDNGISLENLTITGGASASNGGGIYSVKSDFSCRNLTISNNSALGLIGKGGGIYCIQSTMDLVDVSIAGNSAATSGGGIYCGNSSPILSKVRILSNASYNGGGIFLSHSSPTLVNSKVTGNIAIGSGGGIFCAHHSILSLTNVSITDNNATENEGWGGAIYFYDNSTASLVNVTVSGNKALQGGGIASNSSSSLFVNSILWNNSPEEIYFDELSEPNSISIAFSDVQGGEEGIVINNNGMVNWLEGNIITDPMFVYPENGDFHLQEGSPCINTGVEFMIIGGDTLVNLRSSEYIGSAPDMGAFEYGAIFIEDNQILTPAKFLLMPPFPNPFNPATTIRYDLPRAGHVFLTIYDLLGREVEVAVSKWQEAGTHSVVWDATNMPTGIYLVRMASGTFNQVRKMMVLR